MQLRALLLRLALVAAAAGSLGACASVAPGPLASASPPSRGGGARVGPPYEVNGVWYVPREQPNYDEVGTASWYGAAFDGKATADGEIFDMDAVSAAHTTLPLPSIVEVTNLDNGRKLKVRVNDRGPFVGDRIIDLSHEAARQLGYDRQGLARVRVRYIGPAPLIGPEGVRIARARTRSPQPAAPAVQLASTAPARSGARPSAWPYQRDDEVLFTGAPAPPRPRQLQIVKAMPETYGAAPPPARAAATGGYRIQAGAFSEEANARRAAARLASVGQAVIEPTERGGVTLWRVVVPGPVDELQAYNLRQRVAEAGFADAVVIGPS
jgi:rare lipoprotein A